MELAPGAAAGFEGENGQMRSGCDAAAEEEPKKEMGGKTYRDRMDLHTWM